MVCGVRLHYTVLKTKLISSYCIIRYSYRKESVWRGLLEVSIGSHMTSYTVA